MDQFGDVERTYTANVLIWGRRCVDDLIRVCQWHKERGAILVCKPT